jgi:hypothetical protein
MEQSAQLLMSRLKHNADMIMHVHGQMTKTAGGPSAFGGEGKPGQDDQQREAAEHKPTSTGVSD